MDDDAAGSIDDCPLALDLISQGKPKQQSSCPIASVLYPKAQCTQKVGSQIAAMLFRRAAASRLAKDLDGALADSEERRTEEYCILKKEMA